MSTKTSSFILRDHTYIIILDLLSGTIHCLQSHVSINVCKDVASTRNASKLVMNKTQISRKALQDSDLLRILLHVGASLLAKRDTRIKASTTTRTATRMRSSSHQPHLYIFIHHSSHLHGLVLQIPVMLMDLSHTNLMRNAEGNALNLLCFQSMHGLVGCWELSAPHMCLSLWHLTFCFLSFVVLDLRWGRALATLTFVTIPSCASGTRLISFILTKFPFLLSSRHLLLLNSKLVCEHQCSYFPCITYCIAMMRCFHAYGKSICFHFL